MNDKTETETETGTELATEEDLGALFNLNDNMEGVKPEIPKIKIIHQSQQFKMPDNAKVDTITGIILDMNNVRAFWKINYDDSDGEGFPDCFSNDGLRPAENCESPQSENCTKCEKAKFDESLGKYGKTPCKRSKNVHILFEGELLPNRMLLPQSNIKAADKYISYLTSKRIAFQLAMTKMSLKETHNKGGIEYSEIQFEMVERITDKTKAETIKTTYTNMKPLMRMGTERDHE